MAAERQFLVRDDRGRMATVLARSIKGAVRAYLRSYRTRSGDLLSVKERGQGDWVDFKTR